MAKPRAASGDDDKPADTAPPADEALAAYERGDIRWRDYLAAVKGDKS